MILEGSFRIVSEAARQWYGGTHSGEDLRRSRGCRIHVLGVEPTPARLSTLEQQARRASEIGPDCLEWLGAGRVFGRQLFVAEERFGSNCVGVRLSQEEFRTALCALFRALASLHARALVHGAIGPEFVWRDGPVFRLGGSFADLCGKLPSRPRQTMAPEQRIGLASSTAADVFSLAATLHVLATGSAPNPGSDGEVEALTGLGDLFAADPDLRPTADDVVDRAGHRPNAKQPRLKSRWPELSSKLEGGKRLLALEGAPRSGVRFALTALACESESRQPIYVQADEFGSEPLGVAKAVLAKLGVHGPFDPRDERDAVHTALEEAVGRGGGEKALFIVVGAEEADEPSLRMLMETCGTRGLGSLVCSFEGVEAPSSFESLRVDESWRWTARLRDGDTGIAARQAQLSAGASSLLELISVAPPGCSLEELTALLAMEPEGESHANPALAANELVLSGIVSRELDEFGAERYRIVDPAIARDVCGTIGETRRQRLHGAVADLIELSSGATEARPFLVHHHRVRNGAHPLDAFVSLVRRASELADIGRARSLIEEYGRAFDALDAMTRVELLELTDELDRAAELCRVTLQGAPEETRGAVELRLGGILTRQSRYDAAHAALTRAWAHRDHFDNHTNAQMTLDLASLSRQLARLDETQDWLKRAAGFVESEADPILRASYLTAQAKLLRSLEQYPAAIRELRRASELLTASRPERLAILTTLGNIHADQDCMDEALASYREALTLARALGRRSLEENARFNVALMLVRMERFDAARTELDSLLLEPLRAPIRARALGQLGNVVGLQGKLDEARELFAQARKELGPGDNSLRMQLALDEVVLLLDHDELAAAEAVLRDLDEPNSGRPRQAYLASGALLQVLMHDTAKAERLLEQLGESVDPVAFEARGELLLQKGDPGGAVEAFEAGLKIGGNLSSSRRRAILLLREARALQQMSRSRRAALVLRQGLDLLSEAPELQEQFQRSFERETDGNKPRSSRAYLEALLSLSELLHRTRDARAVEKVILEGAMDLLGSERVQLVIFDARTARRRCVVAEAGGAITETARVPAASEAAGNSGEARRWSDRGRTGWACGLLVDTVEIGCLVVDEVIQDDDHEISAFLRTYCSLAALALDRALREEELVRQSKSLRSEKSEFLTGNSKRMLDLIAKAKAMASSESHILILGDSGVGKTQLAREIHRMSGRRSGPFFAVDLASEPADLVSANLFGYEKGAFTGATQSKDGYISAAEGGTLFLDEIGDIDATVQQKLLLFLQSKTYRVLGSTRERTADVRVLLATNKKLEDEIAAGRFRRDLFYRLSSLVLHVPSLRERSEDIPEYCAHFFEQFCQKESRELKGISPAAMAVLTNEDWPGNVRDLMNCLRRAVLLAPEGGWIEPDQLALGGGAAPSGTPSSPGQQTLATAREALDRRMIVEALRAEGNNRSRAARRLDVTRQGLLGMMRRYAIDG